MIRFGFKDYEVKLPNWSKHHKTIGVHVKRTYQDGKEVLPQDESLKILVKTYEDLLESKGNLVRKKGTVDFVNATDYYLPLYNLDYEESNLDYYSVGASNTKYKMHIRFTFLLDYDTFIFDYSYKSGGSFASSFHDMICHTDAIEDIIEEVVEQGKPIEEVGIARGKDEDYKIVVVTEYGRIMDYEIEKRELLKSLVGVEAYRFDHEIVD